MIRVLMLVAHPPRQQLSVSRHLRQAEAPAEQSAQLARVNRLRPRHQSIPHVLRLRARRLEMHPLPFHVPTPFLHCLP